VGKGAVAVDAVWQSFSGGAASNAKEKDHTSRYKSQHQDGTKKHVATNFSKPFDCTSCGTKHRVREYPAFQKECSACGRLNHFAKMCRITKYNNQKFSNLKYVNSKGEHKRKNVQAINFEESDSENENLRVGLIKCNTRNKQWRQVILIENQLVNFKLDSGSDTNIMPWIIL
jgi:hypothetical protein